MRRRAFIVGLGGVADGGAGTAIGRDATYQRDARQHARTRRVETDRVS